MSSVEFPDKNLERAIRKKLGLSEGEAIAKAKLLEVEDLDLGDKDIRWLNEIQEISNLSSLSLNDNAIRDISFLSSLIHLQTLDLSYNLICIEDSNPFSRLDKLQCLNLSYNHIEDINLLSSLTHLQCLNLSYNHIEDITPLSGLNQLEKLYLSQNKVRDLQPLSNLSILRKLWINSNCIDIDIYIHNRQPQSLLKLQPLLELQNLEELYIANNPFEKYLKGKTPEEYMLRSLKEGLEKNRSLEFSPKCPDSQEFRKLIEQVKNVEPEGGILGTINY